MSVRNSRGGGEEQLVVVRKSASTRERSPRESREFRESRELQVVPRQRRPGDAPPFKRLIVAADGEYLLGEAVMFF
jgi:hypothetical protein